MGTKKIALIIGSTRAVRVGPRVADFVYKTLVSSKITPITEISIVDIAAFALPVYNETVMPATVPHQASFTHEHSIAWSTEISKYDAYIFVSAEYNYGLPGGIKNAIDYLYNEWIGKPVMIVTYGIHGGQIASRNLNETLRGMKLRLVETRSELKFGGEKMEEVFGAIGGVLGEKSLILWEETQREVLVKAYGELVELLETPMEPVKVLSN